MPDGCRVAAVAIMINSAIAFESPIPT